MILLAVCAAPVAGAGEAECEQSGSKSTPSPDGRWTAHVQEEVCATASGAAAGITVVLPATADPSRSKRVFIMPVPGSREDWPRIRWQGPDAMELRVPNLSEPSQPDPEFEGVRISLAFCGDNPADRARMASWKAAVKQWQVDVSAWAQRRKQDATTAGPRPPRPEEPVLSTGRCID